MKAPRTPKIDISSRTLVLNSQLLPCSEPLIIIGDKSSEFLKENSGKNTLHINCKDLALQSLFVESEIHEKTKDGELTGEYQTIFKPGKLVQGALDKNPIVLENLDQAKENNDPNTENSLTNLLEAMSKPGASYKFAQKQVKFDFSQTSLGPSFSLTILAKSLAGELKRILENLSPEALENICFIQLGKENAAPRKEKKDMKNFQNSQNSRESYIINDF